MNLMVTTNQKPIINNQKTKRKEPKHNAKENHQPQRKNPRKEKRKRSIMKTTRKQLTK